MREVEQHRRKFGEAMRRIEVGATLRKIGGRREWKVLAGKRRETSTEITIGCGLRTLKLNVPICMSGPCLMDVGMESVPPNAQVHRKNRRSEAKAGFSGATPC